jgi:hypothetical protein
LDPYIVKVKCTYEVEAEDTSLSVEVGIPEDAREKLKHSGAMVIAGD